MAGSRSGLPVKARREKLSRYPLPVQLIALQYHIPSSQCNYARKG